MPRVSPRLTLPVTSSGLYERAGRIQHVGRTPWLRTLRRRTAASTPPIVSRRGASVGRETPRLITTITTHPNSADGEDRASDSNRHRKRTLQAEGHKARPEDAACRDHAGPEVG